MERAALVQALDDVIVDLQHIGSTSIPGLPAKPTIDILLGTKEWPWPTAVDEDLEQLRYSFYKAPEENWRVYLKPWRNSRRGYHLHIVEHDSDHWRRHLHFRDYLRTHAEEARRYESLKHDLAKAHTYDRGKYQQGKAALIAELTKKAREWAGDTMSKL
jgi:GrpB-like predicted nucleotidyltransferase (UPF0157 family)